MKSFFRFGRFNNDILITNDLGKYYVLTEEDFYRFTSDTIPVDSELYRDLLERHFIINSSVEKYVQDTKTSAMNAHAYLFSPTSLFIIVVTNDCNNHCVYCQANGCVPEKKKMNLRTVDQIIERIQECPAESITLEFQGGEPLLNFPAIREAVQKAKEVLTDKKVNLCLVSNLSVINDEMIAFFKENDVSISTSIDGPAIIHNANRPGKNSAETYKTVIDGICRLRDSGIIVGGIQTTTKQSLPYAEEIVREYAACGFDSIFIRPLTELGEAKRNWSKIGYSAEEFISFYNRCLNETIRLNQNGIRMIESHAEIFLKKILGFPASNYMELRSPCGAGVGQMAFTPDGNVYTCDEGRMAAEMGVNAFCIGNVFKDGYNEWIESRTCKAVCAASLLESLPGCCECVYQPYCGTCPVVNYMQEGNMVARRPNSLRCKIYRGMIEIILNKLIMNSEQAEVLKSWVSSKTDFMND